MKGKN